MRVARLHMQTLHRGGIAVGTIAYLIVDDAVAWLPYTEWITLCAS